MQDVRYAWRSVCATPRLTIAATACAALGLGAAIFMATLVNAVLLSNTPLPDADRLVRVWSSTTGTRETADVSYPEFLDIRDRAQAFDAVEAAARTRLAVTTEAGTERLRGESVTPGYFALVGVTPVLGRLFDAREYAPDADRPVIIGYDLWQRRFGGRPDVLGQAFRTRPASRDSGATVRTIVGVMPAGFVGTVDPDVSEFWLPIAHYEPASILTDRLGRSVWLLGRLRPGIPVAAARTEIATIAATLAVQYPAAYDRTTLVAEPFGESWRSRLRLSLLTLLSAAGLLLVIACTNIAALLLARIAQRERELVVREALGAPRWRLVRQLLLESVMIAAAGGVVALAAASAALRVVAGSNAFGLPPYVSIAIDPRVAIVGVALVAITGLCVGMVPARLGTSMSSNPGAAGGHRVSAGQRQRRYGRALVVAQIAFTFLLLVGASLLLRTYQRLIGGDLGFRTANVLRMAVTPDAGVFRDPAARVALAGDITRTFDAYPGVRGTAVLAGVLPPWFDDVADLGVDASTVVRDVGRHAIDRAYLSVMKMSIVAGRALDVADRASGALVSASLAARITQATGRNALGQSLRLTIRGGRDEAIDIVGVVSDVQYNGPLRPRPADFDVYVPLERGMPGALSIAIQTDVDPASLIEPLSRELGRLAPTSPQHWISTMEGELALQYRDARLYASLSGVYGVAAALIAVLGIYSVLANHVARRQREIGIRIAVGARPADISSMVLADGARTLLGGLAIGVAVSLFATKLLSGLLYGVSPGDTLTFGVVAAGLLAAGLAACALPSWRAGRVDPLVALRTE